MADQQHQQNNQDADANNNSDNNKGILGSLDSDKLKQAKKLAIFCVPIILLAIGIGLWCWYRKKHPTPTYGITTVNLLR